MPSPRMLFLIDENVPQSVAAFFRSRGHDVRLVTEFILPGTPDPVIASAADQLSAIVVTWNHKHFKALAAKIPEDNVQRFRNLSRVNFRCPESQGRHRAEAVIDAIEFEYRQAQNRRDKRLLMEIGQTAYRVLR